MGCFGFSCKRVLVSTVRAKTDATLQFGNISGSLKFQAPPQSSYLFLLSLVALEGLIFVYWIGLTLYQVSSRFHGNVVNEADISLVVTCSNSFVTRLCVHGQDSARCFTGEAAESGWSAMRNWK